MLRLPEPASLILGVDYVRSSPTEEILRQYSGHEAGTEPGQRPAGQLHVG
jgi:hypothetical protein